MNLFDALNHSFTTMATGGYSTKQESIAHWDSPFIHYVIILFMFIAMSTWFAYWFKEDGEMTLDEAIKQTADIICHGVMEG